ncbi:MAG: glycosylase, partial [Cyclobacteriaceae bacterium]|nr:glycosylase [Cyclobacteriaceae bacterium]
MKRVVVIQLFAAFLIVSGCNNKNKASKGSSILFPSELIDFIPIEQNPVFTGTGTDTWDKMIRERGYILREDGIYKMWYTGYSGIDAATKYLGYATSEDGIDWQRYSENPIFDEYWT